MVSHLLQKQLGCVVASSLVLGLVASSWAVEIQQIVSYSGNTQGVAVDGTTAYFLMQGPNSIVKVEDIGGANTSSTLVTNASWQAANEGTNPNLTGWYGTSVFTNTSGTYLQFTRATADGNIYRVNTATGAISIYVSAAQIASVTGYTSSRLAANYTTTSTGEVVFYDSMGTTSNPASNAIWITTGAGSITSYITTAELLNAYSGTLGTTSIVSGGFEFDSAGNFYFGMVDGWYVKSAVDGSISRIISKDLAVLSSAISTSSGNLSLKDILITDDGTAYFQDNISYNIWTFDLDDPSGTLELYITKAELEAITGSSAGRNIGDLVWYDGALAWNLYNASTYGGLYGVVPVPEAATLGMLGLGAAALLRRKRVA